MWNIRKPHTTQQVRGLTLVEMLMATALTLIMFAAVAQIFGMMGSAMRDARATIELSGNLRSVSNRLQSELDNVSVDALPWVEPGSNQGYFEIIEGPDRDIDYALVDIVPTLPGDQGALAGDADDMLCFTSYSKDKPFVGIIQGQLQAVPTDASSPYKFYIDRSNPALFTTITSHYAEIVYFTKLTPTDDANLETWNVAGHRDANETVTLYRRAFLIRPDIYFGTIGTSSPYTATPYTTADITEAELRNYYDLSVSRKGTDPWTTNSLERLQDRAYRVAHNGTGNTANNYNFPHVMQPHRMRSFEQLNGIIGGSSRDRTGEDVIMTNALAFDVKVFDPSAVVLQDGSGNFGIAPGELGYDPSNGAGVLNTSTPMSGAFTDLNWSARQSLIATSTFGGAPATSSGLNSVEVNDAQIFGTAPTNFGDLLTAFPQIPSQLIITGNPADTPNLALQYAYYDTWPLAYESDGVDQNGNGQVDEGTNGFDDTGDGVVDDISEYETSPPYPVPLRAVSITIRAIENGTRQVRQDTVISDFLPE
ncbi:PilW family protein [Bremerella sp. T1]|uniref:PilW family protein n=1 Tax=Bremerella sp. TYQ1 TaxID=3119568 RepID=UPI001CCCB8D9|nr:hypothetical protein [Bremerella volcania]UBM38707.1 hypothetical protein LA756_12595 [Bremerella volcania]